MSFTKTSRVGRSANKERHRDFLDEHILPDAVPMEPRRQGKRLGRPPAVNGEWARIRPLIENGTMSQRTAARTLGVSRGTVARLMVQNGGTNGAPECLV